jgi:hypothetical protein
MLIMALKMRAIMLFCVIALCALVSVATGAGAGVVDNSIIESLAETPSVDITKELGGAKAESDPDLSFMEETLLIATAKFLMEEMTEEEVTSVLKDVYDSADDIVMVYIISPRGVIESVYPDEYDAAVGDFIVRSPVGGMTLKAREFFQTDEYTSVREGITCYDAVQPIIANSGQYLGAIIAKVAS